MTQYVCSQLSTDGQTCVSWVEQVTTLEQLAITRDQAHALTNQIVLILAIAYAYVLVKRFADKQS